MYPLVVVFSFVVAILGACALVFALVSVYNFIWAHEKHIREYNASMLITSMTTFAYALLYFLVMNMQMHVGAFFIAILFWYSSHRTLEWLDFAPPC